jgi:hypothetical protein
VKPLDGLIGEPLALDEETEVVESGIAAVVVTLVHHGGEGVIDGGGRAVGDLPLGFSGF